jgi:hypothetical protein
VRGYVDNDVLLKLSAFDLFPATMAALGVTDVRVLTTAKYRLGVTRPDRGEAKLGAAVFARLRATFEGVRDVEGEPSAEVLSPLTEVPGIDQGEAILFASAAAEPGTLLASGDKRSLIALATDARCAALARSLAGRVLCFEQAVLAAIRIVGYEHTRARIAPERTRDKVIDIAFSRGLETSKENAVEAIESYIRDLRAQTGSLLAP